MNRRQLKKELIYDIDTGIFYKCDTGNPVGSTEADGHVYVWVNGNKYRADRLALFYVSGEMPKDHIIHLNGKKHDNWLTNLKVGRKKLTRIDNITGVPGVSWDKKYGKWRAYISVKGKRRTLGGYNDFDNAVLARLKGEILCDRQYNSPAQQYVDRMFL